MRVPVVGRTASQHVAAPLYRPVSVSELEREPSDDPSWCRRVAVVGRGRVGNALAAALMRAGYEVLGPLGRGADGAGADAVLLCVPDQEIASAAAAIDAEVPVGHCSG